VSPKNPSTQNPSSTQREPVSQGIHLVKPEPAPSHYKAHDTVPIDGVYRVTHQDHRTSHEVVLLAGELFPRCSKCGTGVHFELVHAAPRATDDTAFNIRLYEIPHPDEKDPAA
jgi:hypothetical protein